MKKTLYMYLCYEKAIISIQNIAHLDIISNPFQFCALLF